MSAEEISEHENQMEIRIYKTKRNGMEIKRFWVAQYTFEKPEMIRDILNFLNSKCDHGPILQGWINHLEKIKLEETMREECLERLGSVIRK